MIKPFVMDGKEYNVHVMSLTRLFSVKDAIQPRTAQNGSIYRDPVGTYYNYSMTVRGRDDDPKAVDDFWDAVSAPVDSHVCEFPYNQSTLTQRMYITSGRQDIRRIHDSKTEWKDITIQFIAKSPKVTP